MDTETNQEIAIIPIANQGDVITRNELGKKVINDKEASEYIKNWEKSLVVLDSPESLKDYDNRPYLFHTGKSNLLAIDFDSDLFTDAIKLNEQLPEEYRCTNVSQSLGKPGGHFIYKFSNNKLTEFINNPNGKKKHQLDTLYGNTLLFATNSSNQTKFPLTTSDKFIEVPLPMQYLVINHYLANEKTIPQQQYKTQHITGSKLAYLGEVALKDDRMMFKLLSSIMTKEYKGLLEGSHKEHLPACHPDRLPDTESGHMFLLSLANVLRLDQSIDRELYTNLVYRINSMFSEPLDEKRIKATIIQPDLSRFCYDREWKLKSIIVLSRKNEPLEVFKYTDSGKNKYMIYNGVTHEVINYDTSTGALEYLSSMSNAKNLRRETLIDRAIHVNIIDRPDLPFGFLPANGDNYNDCFNIYRWNEVQEIFYNPSLREENYRYPRTILDALAAAMGESIRDHLFLPFLKRKLMTRDHSALFFVLYGVPHSFKSGVFNGILSHFSPRRNKKLSLSVLVDKYNDWQINSDFILLDEIHHLLSTELVQLTKAVNEVTGNKTISGVRAMHKTLSSDIYPQEMTIFMTTNETVQLTTESRDRRMVVFKSTQRLSDALKLDNITIEHNINAEILDFAFYLATEVKELEGDAYITNESWKTEAYYDFIDGGLSSTDKIAKYIDDNNLEDLFMLCQECGLTKDIIERSIYQMERTQEYKIRLYNSREDKAEYPSILAQLQGVNIKKLRQKIKLCNNVKYDLVEYRVGSSEKTGSRKTEMHCYELPEGYNFSNNIEGLEEMEEIEIH